MKEEIELKFFVDNISSIKKKLKRLGAKFEWAGREYDRFFDTLDDRLQKKRATLRLRVTPDFSYLTYKEKKRRSGFKASDEYEIPDIQRSEELRTILEKLGFKVKFAYKKSRREFWRWRKNLITLDSFPFGKFIEIEGTERFIKMAAKKLNLDFSRTSTKSYVTLLREHRGSCSEIIGE